MKLGRSNADARSAMMRRLVVVAVPPTPRPDQHTLEGVVVHAPPNLERFEKATLGNPAKLDESDIRGGKVSGWTVRSYDPAEYDSKDPGKTGVQHEKTFRSKDELRKFLKREESGTLKSSAEASHAERTYVQEIITMPDGSIHRRNVDVDKFL